ncbi:peptide ABC transporter substrate-binding protein [Fluviispira sanaruensis]|uniref:Peptide ABC transporter substrate-binding protein n=1 Tax=Fluviispira sanaruensis TaxID=2493639 RepID=A0A4P2VJT7_FLUSA|nr:peptide ABC transporter substrate-binding protein [Fluviispira sanaruensis]BBH52808.1 peptide ABC transporter substrate-binding protein [Fluviispira sanaruensis]
MTKSIYYVTLSLFVSPFALAALPNDPLAAKVQEMNIGKGGEVQTLDLQKCTETGCSDLLDKLFEGLVQSDANDKIIPAQAESWKISPDGKKYTFSLRKDIKWSDGTKITAHDFVYSLRRLVDPKVAAEHSYLLEGVVNGKEIAQGKKPLESLGVKAIDDRALEITLTHPIAYFLEILVMPNTYPVQKKNIEKYGEGAFTHVGNLVSNGPFVLSYRKNGDKITLTKNNNYWNKENIYLEKVNYINTEDLNAEYRMFLSGQLHKTLQVPVDLYKSIKVKYARELRTKPFLSTYYYIFNLENPKFKDKNLRKALSMIVDRKIITETILGTGQKPLYDFIPYGMKNYTQNKPEWADWSRAQQLEEAKKLYAAAGYSKEKPLKLQIVYNTSENHKKIATSVASMWKKELGVEVESVNEEWKSMLDKRSLGQFEVMRMGNSATINDAYDFFSNLQSTNAANDPKFKNSEYDKYFALSEVELNPSKRKELQEQLGKIILEEVPVITFYSGTTNYLLKESVQGFKENVKNKYSLTGVYLREDKNKS